VCVCVCVCVCERERERETDRQREIVEMHKGMNLPHYKKSTLAITDL
jgi:hypothetical protein